MTISFFSKPVVKNPTRADAGYDSPRLKTDRVSARLGANSGNVAFIHAILGQIQGIKHSSQVDKGYGDVNVLGSSNQINLNIKKSASDAVFQDTNAPFVAIGLGAQAPNFETMLDLPDGTRGYIERIQNSAPTDSPNISLRGHYTYKVLKHAGLHERCVVLGCPSHFIHPHPKLGVLIQRKLNAGIERVAVAPGNAFKLAKKQTTLERSLANLATVGGGGYIIQHPIELMSLVRDGFVKSNREIADRVHANILPEIGANEFRKWFRNNARLFTSAASWMEYLRGVDVVVGTRIHGCMLALQTGTPAVCITLDSRQKELCELMEIPQIPSEKVKDGVPMELIEHTLQSHEWGKFDLNRLSLAQSYREFLVNNGLEPTKTLSNLVSE
ncbi:MAG: polysaccharide pyruvyl transferase family protein [Pseudomonadaceae bacterium]|nr:polysaccharide pyruvyl transferase family protein [Pseudomonadaceae bacterium]